MAKQHNKMQYPPLPHSQPLCTGHSDMPPWEYNSPRLTWAFSFQRGKNLPDVTRDRSRIVNLLLANSLLCTLTL